MNSKINKLDIQNSLIIPDGYEIKEGYTYPTTWSLKRIKDIAPLQRGYDLPSTELKEGDYPVCYSNGIGNYHNEYKVTGPGVFTGRSGTIGNVFYVEENFWPHNTSLWVTDFKGNDEKYIYYLYQYIKLERFNAGTGVPTLNRNDVHAYKIPIPNEKREQKKISSILSTWDKAIELKEKLIEQKKEQKKGLMQKLLTGEVRLPGFDGEWEQVRLGTVIEECMEKTTVNNQYPVLTSSRKGIFLQEEYFSKQVASENNIGYKVVRKGDFTYRTMSDDGNFVFNQLEEYEVGIVSPAYAVFKATNINPLFLKSILNSYDFKKNILRNVQGGTRLSYKYSDLKNTVVKVPPKEEQSAIAEVIFNIENNLNLLEQELEALKQQKKGLMQLLLTGKVRVQV